MNKRYYEHTLPIIRGSLSNTYTSQSGKESQTIDLYLEDNWGNLQQLTYDFNGKDTDEENNKNAA